MAVPKQRHTKSRRDRRRSHHALKKQNSSICPKCNEPILSHSVCSNCGVYANKEIIDVMAKLNKKEKKLKEKEMAAQEKEQGAQKSMDMGELSKK